LARSRGIATLCLRSSRPLTQTLSHPATLSYRGQAVPFLSAVSAPEQLGLNPIKKEHLNTKADNKRDTPPDPLTPTNPRSDPHFPNTSLNPTSSQNQKMWCYRTTSAGSTLSKCSSGSSRRRRPTWRWKRTSRRRGYNPNPNPNQPLNHHNHTHNHHKSLTSVHPCPARG